jgi:hypothetical protein
MVLKTEYITDLELREQEMSNLREQVRDLYK